MLFNSYIFILFFLPLTLFLYFILNKWHHETLAKIVLIGMLLWFYAYFHISYLFLLVASIVCNFIMSRFLFPGGKALSDNGRKILLFIGITLNASAIFYFKYFNFFLENVNVIFHTAIPLKQILMPLGISFFTFQQISYLVDSYRGETSSYHFIDYALFVTFFPQLVAGPIVLHEEMIPQFQDSKRKRIQQDKLARGIHLFAIGLFKKVMIADIFSVATVWGFNNLQILSGADTLLVSLMCTLQLYFDFSGYCDMASGISNMFQFDLPLNFDSPYQSTSIIEFWQRWHISLSRFLRKYVYFPLGGSKKGPVHTALNTLIVFLVSGIWHGANWTYILWGLLHGIANVLNRIFARFWGKVPRILQCFLTFSFFNFTLIIFWSSSLSDSAILFRNLLCGWQNGFQIHPELIQCFDILEFTYLEDHIPILANVQSSLYGLHMWLYLGVAVFLVLFTKNCQKKEFKTNISTALGTITLLVWALLSLSGLSVFLYFNF